MKNIDVKSLIIGALFTSTVLLGMGAVSGPASTTLKLDGPIDLRLGFGSSRPSSSNTSTPTELDNRDTLNIHLSGRVTGGASQ